MDPSSSASATKRGRGRPRKSTMPAMSDPMTAHRAMMRRKEAMLYLLDFSKKDMEKNPLSGQMMSLAKTINGYYRNFPEKFPQEPLIQLSRTTIEDLRQKLAECQAKVRFEGIPDLVAELAYTAVETLEKLLIKYRDSGKEPPAWLRLYVDGTADAMRKDDALDSEIREIAALYGDFFAQGPLPRAAIKTVKYARKQDLKNRQTILERRMMQEEEELARVSHDQ